MKRAMNDYSLKGKKKKKKKKANIGFFLHLIFLVWKKLPDFMLRKW